MNETMPPSDPAQDPGPDPAQDPGPEPPPDLDSEPARPNVTNLPVPVADDSMLSPQNLVPLAAEQACVGCLLVFNAAIPGTLEKIDAQDFGDPQCRRVYAAISELYERGMDTSIREVATRLGRPDDTALLSRLASHATSSDPAQHIEIIQGMSTRRHALLVSQSIRTAAMNRKKSVDELMDLVRTEAQTLDARGPNQIEGLLTIEDFLQVKDEYRWLIPWVMERQDRLIVTGPEGRGKSMLIRQLAVMGSAGLHPFGGGRKRINPLRVLYIDLENSAALIRRKIRPMIVRVNNTPGLEYDGQNMHIWSKPGGLDMRSRTDRAMVENACVRTRPDLLIVGPLYKFVSGNPNDEETFRTALLVLDSIRERHDVAIVIEHHSPHGGGGDKREWRAIGSSILQRWPEFGIGLNPTDNTYKVMELEHTRGDRDERRWPAKIRWGREWPWEAVEEDPSQAPEPES